MEKSDVMPNCFDYANELCMLDSMKVNTFMRVAAAALVSTGSVRAIVQMNDLSVEEFSITANSIEFRIAGNFPQTAPSRFQDSLYFVNTSGSVPFTFSSSMVQFASSVQVGESGSAVIGVGTPDYGEYFFIRFPSNLQPNQSFDETISATWSSNVFDPEQVSALEVRWGSASLTSISGGPVVGTATPVPEPSGVLLAFLGFGGFIARRNRR